MPRNPQGHRQSWFGEQAAQDVLDTGLNCQAETAGRSPTAAAIP
ncbi:MAG: hypothetical protein ACRDQ7_13590 [Haloechinothrix sp.]